MLHTSRQMEIVGIAGLILAIVGLIAIVLLEWLKRPRLEVTTRPWQPRAPMPWTFAVVDVRNKPLPGWLQGFLVRAGAIGCEVTLAFREEGAKGLAMPEVKARWSSQPEPLRATPTLGPAGNVVFVQHFDPSLVPQTLSFDVPAGDGGYEVALAIKREDGSANAFAADSYAYQDWNNPDLELEKGTYEVTVAVNGSGVSRSKRFRLNNLTNDFGAFSNLTPE
jgi:hypothetical protein